MTNKTRKRLWPVSLVMAVAIVGVMAAFLMVASSPTASIEAHDNGVAGNTHCADLSGLSLLLHDDLAGDHDCATGKAATPTPEPTPTPTPTPMPAVDLTAPGNVSVAALDNSMTVRWSAPQGYDKDAKLHEYKIVQELYVDDASNPIADTPAMTKSVGPGVTETIFRGLSYSTYYTYTVQAVFNYDDAAGKAMTKSVASDSVTMRTADSGGILYPPETPPSMPMNLTASMSVPDAQICQPVSDTDSLGHVELAWVAPSDAGKGAPQQLDDDDCGTCSNRTPDHTGGDNAGITLIGEDAEIVTYKVERRTAGGDWTRLPYVGDVLYYADTNVMSGMTYEYRVSAVNSVDLMGAWSVTREIETGTMMDPPGRPSSLVAAVKDPADDEAPKIDDVELQWDPPLGSWRTAEDDDGGEDGRSEKVAYCVQRERENEPNEWDTLPSEGTVHLHKYSDEGPATTVLTQEYTDGDAPAGSVTYRVAAVFVSVTFDDPATPQNEYKVSALSGPSLWNEANEVKTAMHAAPPEPLTPDVVPIGMTCMAAGAGAVTCNWGMVADATNHWVWAHNYATDGGMYVASVDGNTGTAAIDGLTSGNIYAFTVVAGQMAGDSEPSYSGWSNWSVVTVE